MSKTMEITKILLQDSLVPEEEHPYSLPVNWVWVRTGSVNDIVTGSTPAKKNPDFYGVNFPFIKPADLDQGNLIIQANTYLSEAGKQSSRIVPKESTLVCCIGSIGKAGFTLVESTTNQQINSLIPNKNIIHPKFLYYQVISQTYKNQLWNLSSATTISIINKSKMSTIPLLLPPLKEQKRIADKLDFLTNKIDEAKQLIEEAKDSFELRRAAILNKAFRGELTKKWREDNLEDSAEKFLKEINSNRIISKRKYSDQLDSQIINNLHEIPDQWEWIRLTDIIESSTYGTSAKTNDDMTGIPVLRMGNIFDGLIDTSNLKYLPSQHIDIKKYDLKTNDLLFNRTNSYELVGKTALITEELSGKFSFASYLIRIRLYYSDYLAQYVTYYINSHIGRKLLLSMVTQQVGQANINSQKLASLPIPLPPKEEVSEISKLLKRFREMEEQQREVLNLETSIENMKQSILTKAFRGELGTNDPTEENAIELLKEILQEKLK
ncbi:restriction endonuclease subunit S [Planococcus sp. N064]|uniref:Restriction endonuclease subunit S n=1 Tax=Planococcus liqunii TaxID=3058394 RepID=A0ABT8MTJ7_9BACL|nr:restriction endonuclease subunit S [Planococcus sp. N064]MDN7228181.1 restriction endonuclease subunit S [Planococcus sp. N064]